MESSVCLSSFPDSKAAIELGSRASKNGQISDGRHYAKQAGYAADRFDAQYIFTHCCFDIQYLINKQEVKSQGQEQF